MTPGDYRTWRTYAVKIGVREYQVATKPGVLSHGLLDPAAVLLAEHVVVERGDTVVHLNCGNGLVGVVASIAGGAGRIVLADRNVLSVAAAERTLAANGVANAQVMLAHGVVGLAGEADSVAIRIPQERVALLQLLVNAFAILKPEGRCYIAGATNEGIKTAARTLEKLFGNARVLSRDSSHRVLSAVKRTASVPTDGEFANPYLDADAFHALDATLRGTRYQLYTRPGVFSWDHIDEATTILADVMQVEPGNTVLDLGCGCGALGTVAASLAGRGQVTMVDADVEAVRSARKSAEANGLASIRVLSSDVAGAVLAERFDAVVTNPPFHVGKATDLDVPTQFMLDAWTVLNDGGRLFLVANRTLPYERTIKQRFGNVANLHDGPRFKVLTATREG